MIVVSHRGPYRFERNEDGSFTGHRGAGGIVSALSPLLGKGGGGTWIASAMSDDDRVAAASGALDDLDVQLHLVDIDPAQYRMHYDVVANGVLWFLHHGMFDRIRRPRFDIHFRDAWDAFVAVNDAFAEATAERAADGDIVLVQDYQFSLLPGALRTLRPDLRIVHFTHTPFAGPDLSLIHI